VDDVRVAWLPRLKICARTKIRSTANCPVIDIWTVSRTFARTAMAEARNMATALILGKNYELAVQCLADENLFTLPIDHSVAPIG
jgi:hypothetical protein